MKKIIIALGGAALRMHDLILAWNGYAQTSNETSAGLVLVRTNSQDYDNCFKADRMS